MKSATAFKRVVREYYRREGRHGLPWRKTRDPYRILVSEVMLQQTQVLRVSGYYKVFLRKFPDFLALAKADTAEVLRLWQGLGYNRRALALQKLSRIVLEKYNGHLPADRAALEALPGIGPYTAGALLVFAFGKPEVMIETNIRRAYIHFFFPRKKSVTDAELSRCIQVTVDEKNPREWYYALMDYGARLGAGGADGPAHGYSAPAENPNRRSAHYKKQSRFAGSDRELRGRILRLLLEHNTITPASSALSLRESKERIEAMALRLAAEGFIEKKGNSFRLKTSHA